MPTRRCHDLHPKTLTALKRLQAQTPLQIGRHLVRAFEAGFEARVKPIDAATVEGVLSRQIDDLEPQLTRHGYDTKSLADQFDAKPAEIRQRLRDGLDPLVRASCPTICARQACRFETGAHARS